jgi:hypothetical protein
MGTSLFGAAAAGAVASVVERPVADAAQHPQIFVSNVVEALARLASYVLAKVRKASDLKVIGITGSNGKTTTKNLLRAILSEVGPTIAPIERLQQRGWRSNLSVGKSTKPPNFWSPNWGLAALEASGTSPKSSNQTWAFCSKLAWRTLVSSAASRTRPKSKANR